MGLHLLDRILGIDSGIGHGKIKEALAIATVTTGRQALDGEYQPPRSP